MVSVSVARSRRGDGGEAAGSEVLARGDGGERDRFEALFEEVRRDPAAFRELAQIAVRAGMSAARLARGFREHFHTTAAAALEAARVARAEELLSRGESVDDAGFAAGFADVDTFRDRFVRTTGLSPEAFRELGRTPEF